MNFTINIEEYNYPLPDERIAKFPLPERDHSKQLIWQEGALCERHFYDLPEALPEGALLIFNNTKVFRARLIMHKPSGARLEVFCLEPHSPADYENAFSVKGECSWRCLVGGLKKWKEGPLEIEFEMNGTPCRLEAYRGEQVDKSHVITFRWDADATFGELIEHLGRIPIPPYLNRESQEIDNTRYQTVYSRIEGSVAAPTAGLHFTPRLIEELHTKGITTDEVTLHVGAGTFLPVKEEDATRHTMHTEHFVVRLSTLRNLIGSVGRIVSVGTTSTRTIESIAALGYRTLQRGTPEAERVVGQWEIYDIPEEQSTIELLKALEDWMVSEGVEQLSASTQIMITPHYRFRIVDALVTNFHQPKSTLLLLISAIVGEGWHEIYDYALQHNFRFLSYGDSSLLFVPADRKRGR
ncbi:MAG: S-adenosylmethionine:tRNA ribosyltransferase-isomerase [Tidjanibacter sp.]|nr:S-adenosylmethionine:tRNA ribosyltransferase-isomerase [Tidjanibacter sp.]